jgi:hypothetical protein
MTITTIGIYTVGSLVKLSNNHYAIVSDVNKDPELLARPRVIIVMDPHQKKIKGPEINLSKDEGQGIKILTALNPDDHDINVAHYLFS